MKTKFSFKRTPEFLAAQMTLALDFMRELVRAKPDPVKKARAMIAEAIRLIERNRPTHHAAADTARIIADLCAPYFGRAERPTFAHAFA